MVHTIVARGLWVTGFASVTVAKLALQGAALVAFERFFSCAVERTRMHVSC